jgi:ribosomal protein L34
MNKSRETRQAGYIACMSTSNAHKISARKLKGNRSLGDVCMERILLK